MRLYPVAQTQEAPFHEALAPHEAPAGSHCCDTVLKMYPLAHVVVDELEEEDDDELDEEDELDEAHVTPFQ
jgi:hypothetical protein